MLFVLRRDSQTKIRRIYITVLISVAFGLTVLGIVGLWFDLEWAGNITQHHWGRARIQNGNIQFTYAHATVGDYAPRGQTVMRGSFGTLSLRTGKSRRWRWVATSIPIWMVVSLLFLEPAWAFLRGPARRRRRIRKGECLTCGYPMLGNSAALCPECGTVGAGDRAHTTESPDLSNLG